jgi:hypothetical protein
VLHVWFRSVNYVNANIEDGAGIIIRQLNARSSAQFTLDDFRRFWNNYEHYPANPSDVESLILSPNGRNYWRARWDDCNSYFFNVIHTIPAPVDPKDAFGMIEAQAAYIQRYGKN